MQKSWLRSSETSYAVLLALTGKSPEYNDFILESREELHVSSSYPPTNAQTLKLFTNVVRIITQVSIDEAFTSSLFYRFLGGPTGSKAFFYSNFHSRTPENRDYNSFKLFFRVEAVATYPKERPNNLLCATRSTDA